MATYDDYYQNQADEYEAEERQRLRELKKREVAENQDIIQELWREQEMKAQAEEQQQVTQTAFKEALDEMGLTEAEYNQILADNPEAVKELFAQGVKSYVKNVVQRDKKGRFMKNHQPQSQAQSV
ncbi:MAG: hypothetical protein JSW39_22740, partial [Desulfobacterales bacterium]